MIHIKETESKKRVGERKLERKIERNIEGEKGQEN
jgi:hypothetical protein